MQISWQHTSGRLQSLIGYTLSKSFDDSSGYGEQNNPYNHRLSRGLSAFDSTNNFVASYSYTLPIDKFSGPQRLTNGWTISGITRFATGLPVTLVETDDQSLLGTGFGDHYASGGYARSIAPLRQRQSTKNWRSVLQAGQRSDRRLLGPKAMQGARYFHGPGINNWDIALLKNTTITERFSLQFRAEFFNIFNHTQFLTPSGITGLTR